MGIIFPNGTVFGFSREGLPGRGSTLYHVKASQWNDTSTYYVEEFNNTLFPQLVNPGEEDPMIYQDGDGYFHLILHNTIPDFGGGDNEFYTGAHASSMDGYEWIFFGYAYDNNVTFDDGTYFVFGPLQRPHLIFDKDGVTPIAITNAALAVPGGNVANNDRAYTLLRPINTAK